MKRTNLISLTEAMADFNNSVESFDLWSGNCWIDKDGCVVVDDDDWDDWDDDYDDFPHYTKEELEERERKIAELEKKVSEIEKTWCDYEGKMTKFKLFGASPFEFVNHVTEKTEEHTVGKTITIEENNGIDIVSL